MSKTIEISAIFQGEFQRFHNATSDVIIANAELINDDNSTSPLVVKGPADVDELKIHQTYRFCGRWTNYRNRRSGETEKQFTFKTFIESQPHGEAGVVAYLVQAGTGNKVGRARAKQLWQMFGADAVKIAREDPAKVLATIKGVTLADCERISVWLKERKDLEAATIALTTLLDSKGFPKTTAARSIKKWGNKAEELIRKNPYRLMQLAGIGFKKTDALYLELGLDPKRLRRQAFSMWWAIKSNSDGHTWFPADYAFQQTRNAIGSQARPEAALKMMKRMGGLETIQAVPRAVVDDGGQLFIAEARDCWNEGRLASILARTGFNRKNLLWPDTGDLKGLSAHQKQEAAKAMKGRIAILGGGPGTGKTYTAARIIGAIIDEFGSNSVMIAAPTGIAAVRISKALDEYGIPIHASTWHSSLGMIELGSPDFAHNERDPWPAKFIVGDESSMNDLALKTAVFRAAAGGAHVLLLGDIHQLSPVGSGAPFRDMIAAGLSYGELTELQRQAASSDIAQNCIAIREGKPLVHTVHNRGPLLGEITKVNVDAGRNQYHVESSTANDQIVRILEAINLVSTFNLCPVWDCQVLVAVNEKSELGRIPLNKLLQEELNHSPAVEGSPFRLGDKVVNLSNANFSIIEDFELEESGASIESFSERSIKDELLKEAAVDDDGLKIRVANGELGRVVEIRPKLFIVRMETFGKCIKVPRGKVGKDGSTGCSFQLAYALSVHKAQGSEWKVTITVIDSYPGAKRICDRSWIYTADSRPKWLGFTIGKLLTMEQMRKRIKINDRKTFLRERILKANAESELAGI